MSFQELPFLDVFKDASGGNIKTPQKEFLEEGEVPVVDQGKSLIAGFVNDRSRVCKAEPPVIVFGDHTRAIKYVDFEFAMGADGTKVLVPKVESDTKYLYYALNAIKIPAAGYSRHYKFLKETQIPLPPLDEQKRIATILDAADALRAKRRESLVQLDTLLQSTFLDMFGDPVTNPMGWAECTVGDVTDCIVPGRDKPKSFTGSTPWITTDDLVDLGVTMDSPKGVGLRPEEISQVRARVIPKGSVIISCVGDLGISSIAGCDLVVNQQLHTFQCEETVIAEFLTFCLPFQKPWMQRRATQTTLPYLNKTKCNSIPVIVPPLDLQQRFAAIVESIEKQKARHRAHLAELDTLFASIQQRAFRGDL